MSTDIILVKLRYQSAACFGSRLGNLGKKALTNIAITLTRDNLPGLFKQFNFKCNKSI